MSKSISKLISVLLVLLIVLIISNISRFIFNIILFFGKIILPFFLGFVIAYILSPFVTYLEKYLKKRKYAVFVTIFLLIIIIIIVVKGVYPFLNNELTKLFDNLPNIITALKEKLNEFGKVFSFLPDSYKPTFDNILDAIINYFSNTAVQTKDIINKVFTIFTTLIVTPIISIYLLIDFEKIKTKIKEYLTNKNKIKFKDYLLDLHSFSSKYVKTTIIVMIIMTMISSIVFVVLGLEYPLFFGGIIAITNIIPYVGPYIGGAFPILYSLTNPEINTLYVLISILGIQLIETNFISPYLHSKRSQTHPIFVILSLSFFGSLFGVLGMLFAVPLFKFIEITLKYYPIKLQKK